MDSFAGIRVGDRVDVRLTYDDYAALPNDGRRYQLIEGDLVVTPAPTISHQRISRNLQHIIVTQVKSQRLGAVFDAPVDVILAGDTVVQPDILFVSRARQEIIAERGVEGAPDLVVEILSDSTRTLDRTTKMRLYARAGVQETWLIDPGAETLEVFELEAGAYVLRAALKRGETHHSAMLGGLDVLLDDIFAPDA
jgi:Uma2 family endonuclease